MKLKLQTDYHVEVQDPKRVAEGIKMMRQMLAKAEQERLNRPPSLPKDWRNRVLRGGGKP